MIKIQEADKVFQTKNGAVHALDHVSLEVEKGDIFGVIGYSGAGKSTLIRLVNRLETPDTGKVFIDGVDLSALNEKELRKQQKEIGMVFQQFNLLENQTVFHNIAIPLLLEHSDKSVINKRVQELLSFVELENKSDVYVSQLSGGQKQRIGIARALATNPKILLCDEATSALDPKTTESILQLLQKINKELGITILLITHEMNVIKKICNKVAVMKEGKVIEQGETIKVFSKPQEAMTKDFVRTVINSEIPETIVEQIHPDAPVVKLTFFGENATQALVSKINKEFDVNTTILFASVNELQGTILGIIILQLQGEKAETDRAYSFLQTQDVEVERIVIAHD